MTENFKILKKGQKRVNLNLSKVITEPHSDYLRKVDKPIIGEAFFFDHEIEESLQKAAKDYLQITLATYNQVLRQFNYIDLSDITQQNSKISRPPQQSETTDNKAIITDTFIDHSDDKLIKKKLKNPKKKVQQTNKNEEPETNNCINNQQENEREKSQNAITVDEHEIFYQQEFHNEENQIGKVEEGIKQTINLKKRGQGMRQRMEIEFQNIQNQKITKEEEQNNINKLTNEIINDERNNEKNEVGASDQKSKELDQQSTEIVQVPQKRKRGRPRKIR